MGGFEKSWGAKFTFRSTIVRCLAGPLGAVFVFAAIAKALRPGHAIGSVDYLFTEAGC